MKTSMSRSIFAAIAVVGITVSALGSVHTSDSMNGTTTAAIGVPDTATLLPPQAIEKSALGKENLELASTAR